jgi:hypothetical protein
MHKSSERPGNQAVEFDHGDETWEITVAYVDESVDGPGFDWCGEVVEAVVTDDDGGYRMVPPNEIPEAVRERALEIALENTYW